MGTCNSNNKNIPTRSVNYIYVLYQLGNKSQLNYGKKLQMNWTYRHHVNWRYKELLSPDADFNVYLVVNDVFFLVQDCFNDTDNDLKRTLNICYAILDYSIIHRNYLERTLKSDRKNRFIMDWKKTYTIEDKEINNEFDDIEVNEDQTTMHKEK